MPADSGRYPSGQRGQTVNLLVPTFGGSNPPLPTSDGWTRGLGGNSSAVERQPSKLGVAGSNPVSRSRIVMGESSDARGPLGVGGRGPHRLGPATMPPLADRSGDPLDGVHAHVAQLAEHALGKGEVSGSIPDMGSITRDPRERIATVDGGQ